MPVPEVYVVRQPSCTGSRGVSRRLAPLPQSMASLLHALLHGKQTCQQQKACAGRLRQAADAVVTLGSVSAKSAPSLPTVTACGHTAREIRPMGGLGHSASIC